MKTKTQNNQIMEQVNKDKVTQTFDFIIQEIKGKFIMLPQFIHSSNGKFNEAIKPGPFLTDGLGTFILELPMSAFFP